MNGDKRCIFTALVYNVPGKGVPNVECRLLKMLCRVALVRTVFSEEHSTSVIRVPEDDILHVRFEVFTAVTMKNGVF
jgi:hypothetical protein